MISAGCDHDNAPAAGPGASRVNATEAPRIRGSAVPVSGSADPYGTPGTARKRPIERGQAPEIINISWRAQRRLNARWRQLKDARKKPNGIVAVAIARELAGYCWEIATCTPRPDPVPPTSLPAGDPSRSSLAPAEDVLCQPLCVK